MASLVETATDILEQYGLADLSMRRVASHLGVRPSALYWHVKDKQSLLALVADRLLDAVEPGPPLPDWRAELRTRAVTLHSVLLSTRDGAELISSVIALGTGGQRLRTLIAEPVPASATSGSASDEHSSDTLIDAVCSLMLGSAVITQQRAQATELGITGADAPPASELTAMLDLILSS